MVYLELIFGIIWSVASIVFAIVYVVGCGITNFTIEDFGYLAGILFAGAIVGGPFLYFGLKQYIPDRKTKRKGEICFGYIEGVENCGVKSRIAKIRVYDSKKQSVLETEDDVYRKNMEYSEGDFVRVKKYNDDINVISKVETEYEIPEDIRNQLKLRLSVALDGTKEGTKDAIDISEIDTENWTLTEEAFSSTESFVQNINGEYERKSSPQEEQKKDNGKKEISKRVWEFINIVVAFVIVIIIILIVFSFR